MINSLYMVLLRPKQEVQLLHILFYEDFNELIILVL